MTDLDVAIRKQVPTVPQALKALAAMEQQLTTAETYEEIRRVIQEAMALKVLMKGVTAVKEAAENAILLGNKRIAEELQKVPKAAGGDRKSKLPRKGNLKSGREATGIKHSTRSRLGKLADKSDDEIKATADKLRQQGKDATITAVVRELTQGNKKEQREAREKELAERTKQAALALGSKLYGVLYVDPPWQFKTYNEETGMDRAADNHYPTMTLDEIKALPVPAAKDCCLFLWATVPMLPEALEVMDAWKFTYKSHFVWVKDRTGTGFWNLNQHELLLIGTRGNVPAPGGYKHSSVISAPRGAHSVKPFAARMVIEEIFPSVPRLELFARQTYDGWDVFGNEVPTAAE